MIALARRPSLSVATAFRAIGMPKTLAFGSIVIAYWLQLQAMASGYGLRVTSDTPTYVALLRDMALHPFSQVSPFVSAVHVQTSHATPDLQMLAFAWRWLAPDASLVAPVDAYRLLAAWGLVVTALLLHGMFVWTRGYAGSRAAWFSMPVLLTLLGPANVIWAGDLSVHGLLYASYYSQTLGVALLLYALHLLPRVTSRRGLAGMGMLVTTLLLIHPFSGVVFILLATVRATVDAWRGAPRWGRVPLVVAASFALGSAWPAYSLAAAMVIAGFSGTMLVAAAVAAPLLAAVAARLPRVALVTPDGTPVRLATASSPRGDVLPRGARRIAEWLPRISAPALLAFVGLGIVVLVGAWQLWLVTHPSSDPLVTTNRLAIYWNTDLMRWPLLLGAGAVGLAGLARLGRAGAWLPAFWFGSFFAAGLVGSLGVHIPLWYRLLLFCQVPLAAATAKVLADLRPGGIRRVVVLGFAGSLAFRLIVLFAASQAVTYWGASWQPQAYDLGRYIAKGGSGLVAADPYASYYIPAATGHKTLLVSKSHVGSLPEEQAAAHGYSLLHRLYVGDDWRTAMSEMWAVGVRYVVVDHRVTLADPTLEQFSSNPFPLWRTPAERKQLGEYFHRLNLMGEVIADTPQFVIYRLDSTRVERVVKQGERDA
ncbi:MAG: hypothetical protein QOJ13_2286 [Gaiellales bacterium]|jgi:hypothetical protein|nr:hypothetical protein [Gaiellales bacterium]